MEEGMAQCSHGEFVLMDGCPKCIEENRAKRMAVEAEAEMTPEEREEANINSPEGIAARIDAIQPKPNLVKVQYPLHNEEGFGGREYTYYSVDKLSVGDIANAPVRGGMVKTKVSAVDVDEAEIASFKASVKTIPAGSVDPGTTGGGVHLELITTAEVGEPIEVTESSLAESARQAGAEVKEVNLFPALDTPSAVESTEGMVLVSVDPGTAPSFAAHLQKAERIVEIAAAREVTTEVQAKEANDDLTVMLGLKKAVEDERRSFTVPLNKYLSAINEAYKLITGPLLEAEQLTKRALTAYKVELRKKAAEAEKLNQDAIDLARRQAEASGTGEFTVETKPVPVPFVPKLTRTDQGTSGLMDVWKFRIVDLDKIPREYMVPDEAMLTFIAKKQHDKKQVPGVEFYNDPSLRTRRA